MDFILEIGQEHHDYAYAWLPTFIDGRLIWLTYYRVVHLVAGDHKWINGRLERVKVVLTSKEIVQD